MRSIAARRFLCGLLLCAVSARAQSVPEAALPEQQPAWSLRVHLLSKDHRVELRRLKDHALICRTPCDTRLKFRESDLFVLDGSGLVSSDPFQFRPRDGELTLRVSAGDAQPRIAGMVLLGAGIPTSVFFGFEYLIAAGFNGVFCDGDPVCIAHDNERKTTAGVLALVGITAAIAGAVIFHLGHRTEYTVDE